MIQQPGNNHQQPESNKRTSSTYWLSIGQLGLSALGMLILWTLALSVLGIVYNASTSTTGVEVDYLPLLLMATGLAFAGLLLMPPAGLALFHLLEKPIPLQLKLPSPKLSITMIPFLLGLGFLVTKSEFLIWVALPPLHVLTIGAAILWLITLGLRGLPTGSPRHQWGIFGLGLVAAPLFSLLAEMVMILGAGIVGITYLARDPAIAAELSLLSQRYLNNPDLPLDAILDALEPYLMQPIVIYGGLVIVAVFVPLIEELFKPIGVWLLAWRKPTPAQGFSAGILSGAGFALFENLTLSASSGEEWSLVVMARMGTSIIHIVTTGLTGWALALAWDQGKYIRLGVTYLVSVIIHALWNGLVVLAIAPEILPDLSNFPDALENIGAASPAGFMILLVGSLILLIVSNRALKRAIIPPVVAVPGAEDNAPKGLRSSSQPHLNTVKTSSAADAEGEVSNQLAEEIKEEKPINGNNQLFD